MTNKQRAYQVSLLRRLHTSNRYTALYKDDPIAYRAWLKKHLGVDSSKELALSVLIALVEYFEMKRDDVPRNVATSQQIGYLRHLWKQRSRGKDDRSLSLFAKRILKRDVNDIESLFPQEAAKLIAAVKGMKLETLNVANNTDYEGGR